jgi:hypothetical protein
MGGKVFDGTSDFDHNAIEELLDLVNNNILKGTGIECIPVGSAATPTPGKRSGDLDVIVDQNVVMQHFQQSNVKDARTALAEYIRSVGFEAAQSGTNVHVKMPLGTEFHQLDIMVVDNAGTVAKFHKHDLPQNSPYKGIHKQLAIAKIAKANGMLWSAWKGLYKRDEKGKAGEFISNNLDEIAKVLLGGNRNANDLGSLESILATMPKDKADALMAELEQDRNWGPRTESVITLADANHNRIVELINRLADSR